MQLLLSAIIYKFVLHYMQQITTKLLDQIEIWWIFTVRTWSETCNIWKWIHDLYMLTCTGLMFYGYGPCIQNSRWLLLDSNHNIYIYKHIFQSFWFKENISRKLTFGGSSYGQVIQDFRNEKERYIDIEYIAFSYHYMRYNNIKACNMYSQINR